MHLEVSGGPSYLKAEQQLVLEVFDLYDCAEPSNWSSQRYSGCRVADRRVVEHGSAMGFNLGAALVFELQPKLELVVQARYAAGGEIELDTLDTEWLAESLGDRLPYEHGFTGQRTTVGIKTDSFVPRVALRYTV